MKKKLWYILLTVALIVVLAASLSVGAMADDDDPGVAVSKQVTVQEDGTYIVDLEAFATGTVVTTYETVPADIILVLDTSSSMTTQDMTTATEYRQYSGNGNANVSYTDNINTSYYYKDSSDEYHQITITRTGNYGQRTHTIQVAGYTGTQSYTGNNLSMTNLAAYVRTIVGDSSVAYNTLYTATTTTITRIAALKLAVNGFLEQVADQNALMEDPADYSTVSIVTYNGTDNTSVKTGSQAQNKNSFVPVIWSGEGENKKVISANAAATDMEALVNSIGTDTGTRTDQGMGAAAAILNDLGTSETRSHVVVLFTDGYPSTSGASNFDTTYAATAVSNARTCKVTHKATVFSVAVLEGADPSIDPINGTYSSTNIGNVNRMLHGISSNFPNATSYTAASLGTRAEGNHYFTASSADELADIFSAIAQQTGGTTSPVSSEAIMKDIVSSSFTLPEGATAATISVSVVPWDSTTHTWSESVSYTADEWKTECLNHLRPDAPQQQEDISIAISEDGKTIDVTGFDYAAHYQATADPNKDKDGVNKQTAKLVIHFPIQARPSAVTGGEVATNGPESGIYLNGDATEAIIYFPVPQVVFTPVTYVVDYVTLPEEGKDNKPATVKLDYSSVLNDVQMLDDPSDDVLIGEVLAQWDYTIYEGRFGTISFGENQQEVERRYVRYSPTTMNWSDYDRIFIKGESAHESDLDVWAMLAVIPANSIYYEDSFVTATRTATYAGQSVEIQYTGIKYDGQWDTDGEEGDNKTQHAGDVMGWTEGMADDKVYSNDSIHVSNTANATATFTFTGTGVDIYSRTDNTTGTILVMLRDAESNGVVSFKIIDNKSAVLENQTTETGAYYQIPTCTFTDLDYGTYTVTIRVTAGGATQGRMTYYLDGVRVYNPIQPLEGTDEVVQEMYGEKNLGAVFTEVRSLLSTGGADAAAVFINEHTIVTEVEDTDAIDAAYDALKEAQAALDEWNAANQDVAAAQAEVATAEAALAAAKADLAAAEAALQEAQAADPVDEAAVAEAQAAVDDAQEEVTAKEGVLEGKQEALEEAYAAQSAHAAEGETLLAAVAEANAAYQEALGKTVEVPYTEATLAEYTKEGPKSELYLDNGETVAIKVKDSSKAYFIGLKEITGNGTTVSINNSDVPLTYTYRDEDGQEHTVVAGSHTTDLYYEVTPVNGIISITNTGNGILSVTKLRTSGVDNTDSGTKAVSPDQLFQAYRLLAAAPAADYTGDVLTEEAAATVDPAEVTTTDSGEAVTEITLDEDDITIENAEPIIEVVDDEAEPAEDPGAQSAAVSSLAKLLASFFGFFRR